MFLELPDPKRDLHGALLVWHVFLFQGWSSKSCCTRAILWRYRSDCVSGRRRKESIESTILDSLHLCSVVDPSGGRASVPAVDAGVADQRRARAALHVRLFDPWLPGAALPRDPAHPGHSDQPCADFNRELVEESHTLTHTVGLD